MWSQTTLTAAQEYHAAGITCMPLPRGSKIPGRRWRQWQSATQTRRELEQLFSEEANIAAVCGTASGKLVVLDADDACTFDELNRRLSAAGIQTWTTSSNTTGRHAGGGHFWLRTPQPVRTAKSRGLDIRGEGAYVLLPPSLHPCGSTYTFVAKPGGIFNLPSLTALPWLPLEPARQTLDKSPSRLAWRLLQGDASTVSRYASRSEAECALVASLARVGYEFDEIAQLFITHPGPGKFAELYGADGKNAMRYLRLTYENALDFIADNDSEAVRLAQAMRAWALSRPWPGQTGATDRAVYLAHLDIVERCGHDPHASSARELAELSGVTWQTVSNAHDRLRAAGLLQLVTLATPTLSARYSLVIRSSFDTQSPTPVMECQFLTESHDVFRFRGLGKTGCEVWAVLHTDGGGLSVADIAAATGRSESTVRRKLRAMHQLGMAEPVEWGRWQAVADVDLDEVAAILGTAGVAKRQRSEHLRDRRVHLAKL